MNLPIVANSADMHASSNPIEIHPSNSKLHLDVVSRTGNTPILSSEHAPLVKQEQLDPAIVKPRHPDDHAQYDLLDWRFYSLRLSMSIASASKK